MSRADPPRRDRRRSARRPAAGRPRRSSAKPAMRSLGSVPVRKPPILAVADRPRVVPRAAARAVVVAVRIGGAATADREVVAIGIRGERRPRRRRGRSRSRVRWVPLLGRALPDASCRRSAESRHAGRLDEPLSGRPRRPGLPARDGSDGRLFADAAEIDRFLGPAVRRESAPGCIADGARCRRPRRHRRAVRPAPERNRRPSGQRCGP